MTIDQVMYIDYRTKEGKEKLKKALCMIVKPFGKYEQDNYEVPLEIIEKMVSKMCRKYDVSVQWATFSYIKDTDDIISISIIKDSSHEFMCRIQCNRLYEMMTKVCIKIYNMIKKKEVDERKNEK